MAFFRKWLNLLKPIEDFSASVYLRAFPGLLEADFDGVEIMEGIYAHENDKLNFERRKYGRVLLTFLNFMI